MNDWYLNDYLKAVIKTNTKLVLPHGFSGMQFLVQSVI